jgi:hypothetical protein
VRKSGDRRHDAAIGLFVCSFGELKVREIKDDPTSMPEWGNMPEGWDRAGGAGAGAGAGRAVFKEYTEYVSWASKSSLLVLFV